MENNEFKFEPIWVTILGLIGIFIVYTFLKEIFLQPKLDYLSAIMIVGVLFIGFLFIPMFIKMLLGIPAITYTNNQLVDNVLGVKIDWSNIKDIRISGVSKPFITLILKDKKLFFQNINNPVKRIFIKFYAIMFLGDFSINLAMVAGDNDAILAVTQVYWNRYYGIND